jgi:hypothetical protein
VSSRVEPTGIDSRWNLGRDDAPVRVAGGELYGASMGAPRELLLRVNGFDELCDTIGGEDWQLGVRLQFAGACIEYERSMLTIESNDLHRDAKVLRRIDRVTDAEAYMERLAGFGVSKRHFDGPFRSSNLILDVVHGLGSWATHGNYYWLADLRPEGYAAMVERFPKRFWFDGCPLATM